MVTSIASIAALPLADIEASNSLSFLSRAVPLILKVSLVPGMMSNKPTWGFSSMF